MNSRVTNKQKSNLKQSTEPVAIEMHFSICSLSSSIPETVKLQLKPTNIHSIQQESHPQIPQSPAQILSKIWKQDRTDSYREAKLDRAQSNDENTGNYRDGVVTNCLRRAHQTGLPRTHSIPAPRVQKWLPEVPPIFTIVPETHPLLHSLEPQLQNPFDEDQQLRRNKTPSLARDLFDEMPQSITII